MPPPRQSGFPGEAPGRITAGCILAACLFLPHAGRAQGALPERGVATASRHTARGEELAAAGKQMEAAQYFQLAAEASPQDWALWDRAGWAWIDAGNPAAAVLAFQRVRETGPRPSTPPGGMLVARYLAGEVEEALGLLRHLAGEDELPAAEEAVRSGLGAPPGSPARSLGLGYLYTRVLGGSARGRAPLELVARAEPRRAEVWLLLADLNSLLNDERRFVAAARTYLELAPQTADAYRLRAARYAASREHENAIEEYREGIARHPTALPLHLGLVRLYERLSMPREAEQALREMAAAGEKAGDTVGGRSLRRAAAAARAGYLLRRRRYGEAAAHYEPLATAPGAQPPTIASYAATLALSGRWAEAGGTYERLVGRLRELGHPDEEALGAALRAALAHLAAAQGPAQQSEAVEAARKVLQALLLPGGDEMRQRTATRMEATSLLAWLRPPGEHAKGKPPGYRAGDERWAGFTWRREPEEGELEVRGNASVPALALRAMLFRVVEKQPECWPARYMLARSLAAVGFTGEAVTHLQEATRLQPDWWAPHFALAQHHVRHRDREAGLPVLRTVLRLAPDCRPARVYFSLLSEVRDDARMPPEDD